MFWIDVYDPTGNRRGDGPLVSATSWQQTRRLSRAGSISTRIPASDVRAVEIQPRDELRCFARRGGLVTVIGAGIVEDMVLDATGEWLGVSGDDLLRELAWRTVGELELKQSGNAVADDVSLVTPADSTSYPEMVDGSPSTFATVTVGNGHYLYIRYRTVFDRVNFDLGSNVNDNHETLSDVQYFSSDFDGSGTPGWKSISATDGTLSGSASMAVDGTISFTRPTDWEPVSHNGVSGYILRLQWTGALDPVDIHLVVVRGWVNDADDVETVMGLAPAGWIDNATNTASGTLHPFQYESVLEALVLIADRSGEHFRLANFTTEYGTLVRLIEWLQTAGSTVTARLMQAPPDSTGIPANHGIVTRLTKRVSSYEKVTRLYAFGGGNGPGRITLAGVTDTSGLPGGWSISTANSYLDTGGSPRVDAYHQFSDVQPIGAGINEAAAQELFKAAIAWLENHSVDATHYDVEVTGLETEVEPGDAVTLVYRGSIEDDNGRRLWVDINGEFLVLEVTTVIDENGMRAERLLLSGDRRYPETDEQAVARALRGGNAARNYAQPQDLTALRRQLVSLGVVNAV